MKIIIGVIIAIVLIAGGYYLFDGGEEIEERATGLDESLRPIEDLNEIVVDENNQDSDSEADTETPSEHTIEFTSSGYSPSTLTINKGDTVTFINNADTKTWPASNVHPTHTIYPNSDIKKCGTSVEDSIFDACRGLEKGETYSFTFNEVGSWQYHDHLSSNKKGTIIVQ